MHIFLRRYHFQSFMAGACGPFDMDPLFLLHSGKVGRSKEEEKKLTEGAVTDFDQ